MAGIADILEGTRNRDAAPHGDVSQSPASLWEQRILQLDGKRYSLRLEHEFWAALEAIALRRKLRLNRLVAEVAARRPAEANLSSLLRVFCLAEMERTAGGRALALKGASITVMVEAAPVPALLLDAEQIVLAVNDPFLRWSGLERPLLSRQNLAEHFRLQDANRFESLWSRRIREERTRIIGIMRGQALAADARLVPVLSARGRRLCVVWVIE